MLNIVKKYNQQKRDMEVNTE